MSSVGEYMVERKWFVDYQKLRRLRSVEKYETICRTANASIDEVHATIT
jgi:hypothetical protein